MIASLQWMDQQRSAATFRAVQQVVHGERLWILGTYMSDPIFDSPSRPSYGAFEVELHPALGYAPRGSGGTFWPSIDEAGGPLLSVSGNAGDAGHAIIGSIQGVDVAEVEISLQGKPAQRVVVTQGLFLAVFAGDRASHAHPAWPEPAPPFQPPSSPGVVGSGPVLDFYAHATRVPGAPDSRFQPFVLPDTPTPRVRLFSAQGDLVGGYEGWGTQRIAALR